MVGPLRWMPFLLLLTLLTGVLAVAPRLSAQQSAAPFPEKQSQQPPPAQPNPDATCSISGTIVDQNGNAVVGAHVTLVRPNGAPSQNKQSDDGGQFFFVNVPPGPFQLTITATGFAAQNLSGNLQPGQTYSNPRIALAVAAVVTQVRVGPEVAEEQIKEQEKQRVFGVVPNFYVTYINDAVPLTPKQKFELAWKTSLDPVTFVVVGATAGLQQAQNYFSDYGQGAEGYGKRYGANYGDTVISTFIGGAILPSILKQDPRYFYKGTGSFRSRFLYAVAMSVICKGDNGHWQANYSGIAGSVAAGGISNLYYPSQDRGADLVFENTLIGIGEGAGANILQEFVIPKLTPKKSSMHSTTTTSQP